MKRRAFTLVELLVVIAVISILAALLLLYCHDNNDRIPVLEKWVAGNMTDPADAADVSMLVNPQISALARYVTAAGVYKCPSDQTALVRSVSMNNRMNPTLPGIWLHGGGDKYEIFNQSQQIRVPSDVYLTLDERSDTINDGSLCVDMSNTGNAKGTGPANPYWMIDYPAGYHNRAGRFSFADGHAAGQLWYEGTTLVPLGQAHPVHTSATDRDVAWLQAHCTYLK